MPLTLLQTDESLLRLEWSVYASTSRVWGQLTESSYLEQWLGKLVHGAVSSRGSFVVDHGDGYQCSSSVDDFEVERTLSYTWKFPDEPTTEVSWSLSSFDDVTKLTLTHSGLSKLLASYRDGWLVHLTFLEASALGVPLPAKMFWNLHSTFALINAESQNRSH